MLTYEQSLEFIHGIARFGSKPGLRRVRMLLERMGNPQDRLRCIHVAGTDGKGSTCTMLSHIYAEAGYKTGLYISPYVVDFRERIQLNNAMIPKGELALSATTVKSHWEALDAIGETPTEFEVVVAIAVDYFVRMQCDLVVMEVGMGGRFDATNIIPVPLCSVITHISMDHMEYLGDTIEKIAMEKCGIIKAGSNAQTVCYPDQDPAAMVVIREQSTEKGNPLHIAGAAETLRADLFGSDFRYGGKEYHVPLAGPHQVCNAVTAIEAVKAVRLSGFAVSDAQIAAGMAAAHFPSRVEAVGRDPLVLLDGGHNPAEAQALAKTLEMLVGRRIHAVVGMLADKDVDACMAAVLPHCADMTAVTPNYPRALPAEELAAIARKYCGDVRMGEDLRAVLTDAYARCDSGDVLLCCGSLYLSSEMRPILLELVD